MREKIFYSYQSDGEEFKSDLHFFIKVLLDHSFKLQSLVFFSEQKWLIEVFFTLSLEFFL